MVYLACALATSSWRPESLVLLPSPSLYSFTFLSSPQSTLLITDSDSVFSLQCDSSSVQRRRSRDPSYRNSHWDTCKGRFSFVGYRMDDVSLICVLARITTPGIKQHNSVKKQMTSALIVYCILCLSEITATLCQCPERLYWRRTCGTSVQKRTGRNGLARTG